MLQVLQESDLKVASARKQADESRAIERAMELQLVAREQEMQEMTHRLVNARETIENARNEASTLSAQLQSSHSARRALEEELAKRSRELETTRIELRKAREAESRHSSARAAAEIRVAALDKAIQDATRASDRDLEQRKRAEEQARAATQERAKALELAERVRLHSAAQVAEATRVAAHERERANQATQALGSTRAEKAAKIQELSQLTHELREALRRRDSELADARARCGELTAQSAVLEAGVRNFKETWLGVLAGGEANSTVRVLESIARALPAIRKEIARIAAELRRSNPPPFNPRALGEDQAHLEFLESFLTRLRDQFTVRLENKKSASQSIQKRIRIE